MVQILNKLQLVHLKYPILEITMVHART